MKIILTKEVGKCGDTASIGQVHILGPIDTTACGLALEEYETKPTTDPVTCPTCQTFHQWAKKISKIKE